MRVTVIAVGRVRPPFVDDVAHYEKLLRPYVKLDVIELRDDATAEQVARRVPDRAHCVLLAIEAPARDSVAQATWLEERRASGRDLCFVIGGADGLDLDRADERVSFGPVTLPHQLARVVVLEQLYRAHRILRNEPYHH
ncbi:23S rRNA (pseudouridine(1915)-N(3))-methyltransferase RlmH [Patulibacter brassicae]|uniref:Ribosomal RNA large subunit methyltransferase H n=1 Tax=Patulibacter brassicae TaxID=1705717 RepID=A0ABU4VNQ1_9ACTN|nr:23S rRNA (pseudouridine(1915)-N(3))-methyltransferase RlmH [Patulibacter brassicae]MDX8153476.1 23S rRNA (pseudouridine(1915)-N(3))-methyltransferase RlmH [Patulibacter brassicae]